MGAFDARVRDLIRIRDNNQCVMCGGRRNLRYYRRNRTGTTAADGLLLCKGLGTSMCFEWALSNRNAARADGYEGDTNTPFMHQKYGHVTINGRGTAIRVKEGG